MQTIATRRRRTEAVRVQERQAALRKLSHLPPSDTRRITHLIRTLVNKLLHEPTVRLQQAAGNGRAHELLDALAYLFNLDTPHSVGEKERK
jgi:glutamyl-tRNA reductase